MAFVIGYINRGVSAGIGLAAEKYYDHRDRKAALALLEKSPELKDPTPDEITNDDAIWALDEAADPPSYTESKESKERPNAERTKSNDTIETYVNDIKPENFEATINELQLQPADVRPRLPYPIVIPQRRPGSKARGFARAYPPDIATLGLDEATFLRFLDNFAKSSKASPWLNALYVSAGAVGFIPGHITLAVSISLQVTLGTAIELQSRYRANAFLDQVNKEIFMPLGLYAMVLMYKPDGPGTKDAPAFGVETVNLETAKAIAKWGFPTEGDEEESQISGKAKVLRPIRLTNARGGDEMLPTLVAPLTYPGLDDLINRPDLVRDESFKQRLQRNKQWVTDYFDKKAQASFAGQNPDSVLAQSGNQDIKFKSRFSDPNHPVNQGHLFTLLSGGKYVAQPRGSRKLRQVGEDGKLKPLEARPKPFTRGGGGFIALAEMGVKKLVAGNVLYLTVVNLPSEEELAEARQVLQADQGKFQELLSALRGGKEDKKEE